MQIRKIVYTDDEVELEATVALEQKEGKSPIIFIFHPWEGKGSFVEEKAQYLAQLGYIGCAVDLYGKGKIGETKEQCAALMSPLMQDRKKLQQRILASLQLLEQIPEADPSRMGAIGFCFGGLCALDMARSNPTGLQGAVSFHGLLYSPDHAAGSINAKILVLHGNNDPMVSREEVSGFMQEMERKKADWQVHVFGQTMHAFTNPKANDPSFGTVYSKSADKRAFALMELFFKELFDSAEGSKVGCQKQSQQS